MTVYLQLLWVFIKIGVLGFGGGYAMLSLIQHEVVDHYGWMTMTDFADMVAISQMTPGPISINMATYVGYTTGGFFGSLLASFALCLPSIIMVYFIIRLFMNKKGGTLMSNLLSLVSTTYINQPIAEDEQEDEHSQHQHDDDSRHQPSLQHGRLLHVAWRKVCVAVDGEVLL